MATETRMTPTAREVEDTKGTNKTANPPREFGKCAVALRHVLYHDRSLNDAEFLLMDTHFQVLQLAYLEWKRKHRPTE